MDTHQPFVITISRELGSGGRTIGRKLAAQLNVRYSDKNLIQNLMEKFNLSTYEIERIKGRKKNWLADFVEAVAPVPNTGAFVGFEPIKGNDWNAYVKVDDIFEAESQILRHRRPVGLLCPERPSQQGGHFHPGSPGKAHRAGNEKTGPHAAGSPRGHQVR